MAATAQKQAGNPTQQEIVESLLWVPSGYKDYTRYKTSVKRAIADGVSKAIFRFKVLSRKFEPGERTRMVIRATDVAGDQIDIAVFDADSFDEWKALPLQSDVFVEGVPNVWGDRLQLRSPCIITADQQGRIVPIYRGRKGLTANEIAKRINQAQQNDLAAVVRHVVDLSGQPEKSILEDAKSEFKGIVGLVLALHAPKSMAEAEMALKDAKQIAINNILAAGKRANSRPENPASIIDIQPSVLNKLAQKLPFQLTKDQVNCVKEIAHDLRQPKPMNRILTGDVGTGKTAVFGLLAASARESGKRVAILAPNILLVEQIAADLAKWWPELPVCKVTSGDQISSIQNNPVLIGTTALIFQLRKHQGYEVNLAIIDEQHKQSTKIREALLQTHSNLLEATATPIPRSTAMIAYGGMGISTLKTCPVSKVIHTRIASQSDRPKLLAHLYDLVQEGKQIAIVYPRVSDDENARSSVEQAAQLWEKVFPGRVGLLHGRMSDSEKDAVMLAMKAQKFDCLVSSTVIEVGVQIPNLVALVTVSPERFGVAQLHQMRGRVARQGGEGFFYMLLQSEPSEETLTRLKLLVDHQDGFELAEKDAALRGYGDLNAGAEQQSGATASIFNALKLMPGDFC